VELADALEVGGEVGRRLGGDVVGRFVEHHELHVVSSVLQMRGETMHSVGPAARRADRVTHSLPARAVAVEVSVLELDVRALRPLGREPNFDLARPLGIGLDLPARADVPAEYEAVRRFVGENPRPVALGGVENLGPSAVRSVRGIEASVVARQ
jgi:hypothetical protein